jgi:heptosyltransferase-3
MISYGDYPDLTKVRRVLVVKLRHHGDVLLSSALFNVLKTRLPLARIDAYIYKDTLPMLEGHPAIDAFHLYDYSWKRLGLLPRIGREIALLRAIRGRSYDLVINLTEGDRGALCALFSGARYRVGWAPEGGAGRFKRRLYTHIVKRPRLPRHMVEQNLDAARRIGIFPEPEQRDLVFAIPEAARERVRELLREAGSREREFALVHPTSRWLFKCWPPARVAALVRELHARGVSVAVSAAPDATELAMIDEVLRACAEVPVINLAGQLNLKELGALIDACRCLICVDSVPMHMASALKRPCVALFGPSSEIVWGPWLNADARVVAQNHSCRPCNLDGCGGSKVSDCLTTLAVDSVLQPTLALLGKA